MRRQRWKKTFESGDAARDRAHRNLVERLGDFADAAKGHEHCQDLVDFHERLGEATVAALPDGTDLPATLRGMLGRDLPLRARNGPACKDCGLCDRLAEGLNDWLDGQP